MSRVRTVAWIGLTTTLLLPIGAAWAEQAKCLAGKTKCVSKKATGLLKCEQLAETPGRPADPNANACVDKVRAKFDGGLDPAKGCFEKLENKTPNDCLTFDDTAALEAVVDSCVGAFVTAIDPPPLDQTRCGAGKKKCVSKKLSGLLKCHRLAQTPGKPADPNANGCVDKVKAKFDGGTDPAKGCFEKLENRTPNDCLTLDDTVALEALVDDCVDQLLAGLATTTTTTTPTSSTTTTTESTTTTTTTTTTSTTVQPEPDLRPTAFTGSTTVVGAGTQMTVSWTVVNEGGSTANQPWYDCPFFSTDPVIDGGDTALGCVQHTANLAAGDTYSVIDQVVTIPNVAPGTYYLLLRTDFFNAVYEAGAEGDNDFPTPPTLTVQ